MPSVNNGKSSEKEYLKNELKPTMDKDHNFIFGRFVDTHDARSFIPPSPSDYYCVYKSQAWLVEIKSSVDLARFPLKNISGNQIGFASRYIKAGWNSIFIIHRIPTDTWYFVPFSEVLAKFKSGKASWLWDELSQFKKPRNFNFWSAP